MARVARSTARPAASPDRRRLLGRLHQLKTRLGLDDDAYREKLMATSGASSAADLSDAQLRETMTAWSRGLPAAERGHFTAGRRPAAGEPYQRLVRALWISLYHLGGVADGGDAALDAFVSRQAKVTALRFLRAEAAPAVIEALKDMLAREGVAVPERSAPHEGRRRVVRAQWAKLHRIGAVALPFEDALCRWLWGAGRIVPGARSLSQLSEDQLDAAIRALGDWIRKAKARETT